MLVVTFDVPADHYDRLMGRFASRLAAQFGERAAVRPGDRALDVGCGTGALTAHLVERLGIGAVSAIDPSPSFVAALRDRFPGLDVRPGEAEQLPFPDDSFDRTLAQLVVPFMTDPVAGLREMARVTRPGGVVAASVWPAGDNGPFTAFRRAVRDTDPAGGDSGELPGTRFGELESLFAFAGLDDTESAALPVTVPYSSFDAWWEPFTLGVGPAGDYVASLDPLAREALQRRCQQLLPPAPFEVEASAWSVRAKVPGPETSDSS